MLFVISDELLLATWKNTDEGLLLLVIADSQACSH